MDRFVVALAVAAALASAGPAYSAPESVPHAAAEAFIMEAKEHADLTAKFCAANPDMDHVLVLPASLFVDSEQVICDSGPYKLYRIIEHDDTDDFEYFLDPPIYGQANR